jgi:hypothetical protein
VGPQAAGPWWLATNLAAPLVDIVVLYDRRMVIEEQFRDTKGCRFGVRLESTQFHTPAYLARFHLLIGVALLLWTAVGQAIARVTPLGSFRNVSNRRHRWIGVQPY